MLQAGIKKTLVILLLLFSLFNIKQLWSASLDIGDRGTETLDRWEADMILLKESLPVNRGVVGYISEEDVAGLEYEYWDNETEFLLTQYALAPLIFKKGLSAEWNVVVLKNEDLLKWLTANPGTYEIVKIKSKFHILHNLGNQ
ncbi:MAG: hypothetical protein IPJ46_24805 [Anaerolineales bacterium]|nr:hypothetical protein [Anaerolineales bacterium]